MDRFETDAREMCLREHVDGVFCEQCIANEAALRDTDAKAREDCAKRCDKRAAKHIQESVRVKRLPERTPLREVMRLERVAAEAQACAAAIREGAGECGTTVPKEPDCWECWDSGEFPPHFHSPEDDCPNFIPSDVPGTDDLGSCGCDLVRCACQGGDDAE